MAAFLAALNRLPAMDLLVSIASTEVRLIVVVDSTRDALDTAPSPSMVTATLARSMVASGGTETRICRPSSPDST